MAGSFTLEGIDIALEAQSLLRKVKASRSFNNQEFQVSVLQAVKERLEKWIEAHRHADLPVSLCVTSPGSRFVYPKELTEPEKLFWENFPDERGQAELYSARFPEEHWIKRLEVVFEGNQLLTLDGLLIGAGKDHKAFERFFTSIARMTSHEGLRVLSKFEALAGNTTRNLFLYHLAERIRKIQADSHHSFLFEIRIDCLMEVNDNSGFKVGDELIFEVCRRLSGLAAGQAFLTRAGGNKFMLLLEEGSEKDFSELVTEIEAVFEAPARIDSQDIQINVDIGCVPLDDPTLEPLEAMQRAELALMESRSLPVSARHKVYLLSQESLEARKKNSSAAQMIRQGFGENRFFFLFQPIVDLRNPRITGAEMLLRLRDEAGNPMPASEIMPTVERIRIQSKLDKWVFSEVIRLFQSHEGLRRRMKTAGFQLAMNCSPMLLSEEGLAQEWISRLKASEFDPRNLTIEIIENAIFFDNSNVIKNLTRFREHGIRIAIDDFGAGYSNLGHLSKLPADIVKMDRGFLPRSSKEDSKGAAVLNSIVMLCNNMGYHVTCEGVETEEQSLFLQEINCPYAQGYFYGKPMPLQEVLTLAEQYDDTALN